MTKLLTKNAKISKANNDTHSVYNFGIPAFESKTGLKTCPMAGACTAGCYAQSGAYVWSNVNKAYEWRLDQTRADSFVESMSKELTTKLKTATRIGKQLVVRIHDSGDFYSLEYINKWIDIMNQFPAVQFYAYTKMVPMFKRLAKAGLIPDNFVVVYSEGGKADHLIDTDTDRHSRVFESELELESAGYSNAMENDTVAFTCGGKVGLVYHGSKAKKWSTA